MFAFTCLFPFMCLLILSIHVDFWSVLIFCCIFCIYKCLLVFQPISLNIHPSIYLFMYLFHHLSMYLFFPKGSEGFSFYIGGLRVDTCSRDPAVGARNRLQPSVHDRRGTRVGVSMGETTRTCLSRPVTRCVHNALRARLGTLWHSICFRSNACARLSVE